MSSNAFPITAKASMLGWTKAGFPANIENRKESIKFVKRLVAIGFSHILYTRTDIPEECFKPHSVGTIDCSMLKAKSNSETANKLTAVLKNAMDALDQGYLRQLIIRICENQEEQEEALEVYTFNFSKVEVEENDVHSPGFNIVQAKMSNSKSKKGQNKNCSMVQNIVESEDLIEDINSHGVDQYAIYNATKMLLRKLNVALHGLQSLPNTCYMNVTVGYHDDITPEDYHPPGFYAYSNERTDENLCTLAIGHVKSNFHEVHMALAAKSYAPDTRLSESLDSSMDKRADSTRQVEENALHNNNTSIIPLHTGLDVSGLEQTKDSGSNIDSTHESNVVEVCNDNGVVENLQSNLEVHSRLGSNRKNARKYSEMCFDLNSGSSNKENTNMQTGNTTSKKRKALNAEEENLKGRNTLPSKYSEIYYQLNRPSAYGDNTNNNVMDISKRVKELKSGDIENGEISKNTSRSSICSTRSPKALNPLRKAVSVRDTFVDKENIFNSQPKASKSQIIIAI